MTAAVVDWGDAATWPSGADIVLGSDLVYAREAVPQLLALLPALLPEGGGGAFYYVAPETDRLGEVEFLDGLVGLGWYRTEEAVPHRFMDNVLDGAHLALAPRPSLLHLPPAHRLGPRPPTRPRPSSPPPLHPRPSSRTQRPAEPLREQPQAVNRRRRRGLPQPLPRVSHSHLHPLHLHPPPAAHAERALARRRRPAPRLRHRRRRRRPPAGPRLASVRTARALAVPPALARANLSWTDA